MLDQQVVALAKAIRENETGNRPVAGATGELASRYQFLPSTWKAAAGRILGDPNAPLTLENENKVAYTRIKEWKDQGYTPGQIASLWNSGNPDMYAKGNKGVGVSSANPNITFNVPKYVENVYAKYLQFKPTTTINEGLTPTSQQVVAAQGSGSGMTEGLLRGFGAVGNTIFNAVSEFPLIKGASKVLGYVTGKLGEGTSRLVSETPIGDAALWALGIDLTPEQRKYVGDKAAEGMKQEVTRWGESAIPAATLGVFGRVVNLAVTAGMGFDGYDQVKEAKAKYEEARRTNNKELFFEALDQAQNGLQNMVVAGLGLKHGLGKGEQGLIFNPRFKEIIKKSINKATEDVKKVPIIEQGIEKIQDKVVKQTASEWESRAKDYVKSQNTLDFEEAKLGRATTPKSAKPSVETLAELGVGVDTVTENGKFSVEKINEVAKDIRLNAKPIDSTLTEQLRVIQQGQTPVSIKELAREVISGINKNPIAPVADIKAMKKSAALKLKAYNESYKDGIKLDFLNEEKGKLFMKTKNWNDPIDISVDKELSMAMMRIIERRAALANSPSVRELNGLMANYYRAADFLETLKGKALKLRPGERVRNMLITGAATIAGEKALGMGGGIGGYLSGKAIAYVLKNASNPVKAMLLESLKKSDPAAFRAAKQWLGEQEAERLQRPLLPSYEKGTAQNPQIILPDKKGETKAVPAKAVLVRDPKTGKIKKYYTTEPSKGETPTLQTKPKKAKIIEGEVISKKIIPEPPKETKSYGEKRTLFPKRTEKGILSDKQERYLQKDPDLAQALRESKGLSAKDIMAKYPDINLKRDVPVTDIYGKKSVIPAGEALTPYELKGNKVLLQDGETYIVSKNQYQNIKGNSVSGAGKEFAPELKGTEETVRGEIPEKEFNKRIENITAKNNELAKKLFGKEYNELTDTERTKVILERRKSTPKPKTLLPPKYSQYQLPGGKNYKEISFKAKGSKVPAQEGHPEGDAWIRLNEHTNKKYGKVTFLEEVQKNKNLADFKDHPLAGNKSMVAGVKRALKEAVDNGSDYLSWTNGEQQAARYNLAKQVDNITWRTTSGQGGKSITIKPTGSKEFTALIDKEGKIITAGGGIPNDWMGKRIDEAVGKGIGEKILKDETGNLSGEGLNIGGEWAKNLYDRQVKNIVEDLTGKKVEVIDLGLPVDGKEINWFFSEGKAVDGVIDHIDLTPKNLKVGAEIQKQGENGSYIITNVLGDGKFKAVPKERFDRIDEGVKKEVLAGNRDNFEMRTEETFDISTKKSVQQAIKITPEIKALVEGKSMVKPASGKTPFSEIKEAPKSNPLLQEARGKTLDEFLKGTTILKRGDLNKIDFENLNTISQFNPAEKESLSAFANTPGIYFTSSESNALSYGKNLTEVGIKPNSNILDTKIAISKSNVEKILKSNPRLDDALSNFSENKNEAYKMMLESVMNEKDPIERLKAIWSDGQFSNQDFVDAMKKNGIDGIKVYKDGYEHYVIYNKDSLFPKSQLLDIWKKANGKSGKSIGLLSAAPILLPQLLQLFKREEKEKVKVKKEYKIPDKERAKVIATVMAEAQSEGKEGMQAVLNVINNRIGTHYVHTTKEIRLTPFDVVSEGNGAQFNGFSTSSPHYVKIRDFLYGKPVKLTEDEKAKLKDALELYKKAEEGTLEDITGGANQYYNPKGKGNVIVIPKWSTKMTDIKKIGNHIFGKL